MKKVCHIILRHSPLDGRVFRKIAVSCAAGGMNTVLAVPCLQNDTLGWHREDEAAVRRSAAEAGVILAPYRFTKKLPRQLGIREAAGMKSLLRVLADTGADIYHFHEDGFILDAALALKKHLPGKKLVFDFHESYLHHYRDTPRHRAKIPDYLEKERALLAEADLVVTVSDFLTDYYRTLTAAPVITVMNCQSEKVFTDCTPVLPEDGSFLVAHEGRLAYNRGLKLIVESMRHVTEPAVRLLVIGNIPDKERNYLDKALHEYGLQEKFIFTGQVAYGEVPGYLASCRAGIDFRTSRNAQTGIANKFFNYMRCGLPVLTLDNVSTNPIVKKANLGFVVSGAKPETIAEQLMVLYRNSELRDELAANARNAFTSEYNWENMAARLLKGYGSLF